MKLLKDIFLFIKNIFNKKEQIITLKEPEKNLSKDSRYNFINQLKVNIDSKRRKKKVETLTCPGDGLGIQSKISS